MRSENDYYKLNLRIRDDNSCDPKQSVYDCLRHASLDTVFKYLDENNYMFHLYPDGEFLPQDIIETQDYNLSQRYGFCFDNKWIVLSSGFYSGFLIRFI